MEDIDLYNSLGVKKIIAKPFNPINLNNLLESFWAKYMKEVSNQDY